MHRKLPQAALCLLLVLYRFGDAFQPHGQAFSRLRPLLKRSHFLVVPNVQTPAFASAGRLTSNIAPPHSVSLNNESEQAVGGGFRRCRWHRGIISNIKTFFLKRGALHSRFRVAIRTFALVVGLVVLLSPVSAGAVSGGRVGGGGFKSSPAPRSRSAPSYNRPSFSSPRGPSYSRLSHSRPPYIRPSTAYHNRPRMQYRPTTIVPIFMPPRPTPLDSSRLVVSPAAKARDLVILAGIGAVLTYGFLNHRRLQDDEEEKVHVGSLTVTFSVPNRRDTLLDKIRKIAIAADTVHGIDGLVSDVCIELMRNLPSIECAYAESSAHTSMDKAQQAYHRQSVLTQSKIDRFGVNKFGTTDKSTTRTSEASTEDLSRPTLALVTIQYASDEEQPQKLLTRDDLRSALASLASSNPRAAEVIWAPGEADELLDAETVYADFPQLVPI